MKIGHWEVKERHIIGASDIDQQEQNYFSYLVLLSCGREIIVSSKSVTDINKSHSEVISSIKRSTK